MYDVVDNQRNKDRMASNGMTFIYIFMKISQLVQKLFIVHLTLLT